MKNNKVVILDNRYEHYRFEKEVFSPMGIVPMVCFPRDDEEAIAILRDADAVLCNLFNMHAGIINKMKDCKVISRYGVGYDNIDLSAATKMGIAVCNVPDYATEDVSDHALALFLDCVRKISFSDRKIRQGDWNLHSSRPCYRLSGKVFGIIGFGKSGKALARKISGLGFSKVLACTPHPSEDEFSALGVQKTDFETLLKESDFVSIHCPLKPETENLFNNQTFAKMKRGAVLINTARGPIVNEDALYQALSEGKLASAAVDVFKTEPLPPESKLRLLDNITLSDHAAWYSEESILELKTKAALNAAKILKGEDAVNKVN